MVDANINLEERSRSSSMTALSGPAFCYSSSLSSSCTPSESSLPLCSSTHRNRVQILFYHTSHRQRLFFNPFPSCVVGWEWVPPLSPPSVSIITLLPLEGKGKNPLFLSFFPSSLSPSPPGRHHVRPLQPGLLPCKNPLPPD